MGALKDGDDLIHTPEDGPRAIPKLKVISADGNNGNVGLPNATQHTG